MLIRRTRVSTALMSVLAMGIVSCSDAPTDLGPEQKPGAEVEASNAALNAMEVQAQEIARFVALALREDEVRTDIWRRIQQSPYPEQKLDFRRLFTEGSALAVRVGAVSGLQHSQILARLDQVGPLEFYMPVPDHREKWIGGDDLLVATALIDAEGHHPVGFTLDGQMVQLDRRTPPQRPTLAVVPAETDFEAPPRPLSREVAASTIDGIWISKVDVWEIDRWEGWLNGSPEFEVHAFVHDTVYGDWRDLTCAGEFRSGDIYFDYNSGVWYGNLLAGSKALIGEQEVEFQLWEDDLDACKPSSGRPPKTTTGTVADLAEFASVVVDAIMENQSN